MNDDEMRSLFREMREEAVPADSLARVRLTIAAQTRQTPVRRWWVPLLIAAACGVAMLCAVLFRAAAPVAPAPAPVTWRQPLPDLPVRTVVVTPVRTRRVIHHAPPQPQPGTVVRIETNDPDVVILLIG